MYPPNVGSSYGPKSIIINQTAPMTTGGEGYPRIESQLSASRACTGECIKRREIQQELPVKDARV